MIKLLTKTLHSVVLLLLVTTVLPAQLSINEFQASNNSTIADSNGEFEDWIEIYNAGSVAIDLAGYYISDNLLEPLVWQIPTTSTSLTTVPAGGFLILWADKDVADGANHIDIKLGADGEDIVLTDPDGINRCRSVYLFSAGRRCIVWKIGRWSWELGFLCTAYSGCN